MGRRKKVRNTELTEFLKRLQKEVLECTDTDFSELLGLSSDRQLRRYRDEGFPVDFKGHFEIEKNVRALRAEKKQSRIAVSKIDAALVELNELEKYEFSSEDLDRNAQARSSSPTLHVLSALEQLIRFVRWAGKSLVGIPATAYLASILIHWDLVQQQSSDIQYLVGIIAVALSVIVVLIVEPLKLISWIMRYLDRRRDKS